MPASVVLGAQWGDEGKGKLVDQLAQDSDWVVRFQGGNNAGHTIVVGETVLKLHQLPSGLTNPDCQLVLGAGMVIDPWVLDEELQRWKDSTGETPDGERLWISERASVILPFHRRYDGADKVVGTTGRGIGPAYRDRIERVGIRFCDIEKVMSDPATIRKTISRMNWQLKTVKVDQQVHADELKADLQWILDRFSHAIKPTGLMVDLALRQEQNILLEGAQGCLLDIDHGTYPFVTSSVTSRANASHGAGIHPGHIGDVYGVVKAYTTRVGNGPFPSELFDEVGEYLGEMGHEFGTTTGRPRRCGWLDLVVLRHAHRLNGFTELTLTKLDVLGGLDELEIVVGYDLRGQHLSEMPTSTDDLAEVTCITEKVPGFPHMECEEWLALARRANESGEGYAALPKGAREYVEKVEALLGIPIKSVGVGPDRDATIYRD